MQIGKQSSKYSTFPYSPFSYRTRILIQLTLSYFCSTPLTSVRLHLTHQFSRTLGHEQEKLSHLDKGSSEPLTMSVNETYEVLSYAELRIRFNSDEHPSALTSLVAEDHLHMEKDLGWFGRFDEVIISSVLW